MVRAGMEVAGNRRRRCQGIIRGRGRFLLMGLVFLLGLVVVVVVVLLVVLVVVVLLVVVREGRRGGC